MDLRMLVDKRIVFFAAEAPPSPSGSGIMAHRLARYLVKYSESVKLISFNYNNLLQKNEIVDGVLFRRIIYFNRNILTKVLSFPRLLYSYYKESLKADLCFIYGCYMPGFELIMINKLFRKQKLIYVSTLINDDDINTLLDSVHWPLNKIRKFLFSRIDLYNAINTSFEVQWKNIYNTKVPVVLCTQGVDVENNYQPSNKDMNKLKTTYGFPLNIPIILSVGFLIERKGYRHVFDALEQLDITYLYVIAGLKSKSIYHRSSSQELREMEDLYEYGMRKLGNKVLFLDNHSEMKSIYSCADIFLHGASREGTPNVILEAMMFKKAIIARYLEGLDFLLKNNQNVLLYESGDELNQLIKRLLLDKKLSKRIAENAHETIMQNHTSEMVAKKIFNCI